MKKSTFIILLFLFLLLSCFATDKTNNRQNSNLNKYTIQSDYLKNPEKSKEFVTLSADFWEKSYDKENGGFYTYVESDGIPSKGNNQYYKKNFKTILTQSRNAYAFTKAYMLTGNDIYLEYAKYAIEFLQKYGWDKINGGFYSMLDKKGNPIDDESNFDQYMKKWSFTQHYALLGISAISEATRNEKYLSFLNKGRQVIDDKLWDKRPGLEGYYDSADYDWSNQRDKGFTPTVDCITTHGLSYYLLTDEYKYKKRLIKLADIINERMVPTINDKKIGFEENYTSNWESKDTSFLFIGHVLKSAWCLARVYLVEENDNYKKSAETLINNIINKGGWDEKYGGPFSIADSKSGMINYTYKDWWTIEQAITSGLITYYITGNKNYLKIADQSIDFFINNIIDWENGGAFGNVNPEGKNKISKLKGDIWKAGYHTIETGYYIYTYGNLYIHKKPVQLYYNINKSDKDRKIKLTPIAIEDSKLIIKDVEFNGKSYTNFDPSKRILTIPKNTGGEFKITYTLNNN